MSYDTIKLLNLEDFDIEISSFEVTKVNNILHCYLKLKRGNDNCIVCGSTNLTIKDYRQKKIVHSISTNSPCYIIYLARRYKCVICDKIFYENNPFAMDYQKISLYTQMAVLEALKDHTTTFTNIAGRFNLTKVTVINIFDSYVNCTRRKLPEIICMDEFYTARLSRTKYAFVMLDFVQNKIIDIYSSRHKFFLANQFNQIPKHERNNVKYIIIDMWDTYKDLANLYFNRSQIAVDSFHVIKHLNNAMNSIRLRIMRKFDTKTNRLIENDKYYYMLKKFHYFFTKTYDDIYSGKIAIRKMKTKWHKDEIRKYLLSIDIDLAYAYWLKEKYREFNLTANYESCDEELEYFIDEFTNSHLEEFRMFGRLLRNWKQEIKNSFIRINGKRLSNAPIEGVNSRIKTIIKNANGYQNFNRLRNRIIYSINKDVPLKGNPKN